MLFKWVVWNSVSHAVFAFSFRDYYRELGKNYF